MHSTIENDKWINEVLSSGAHVRMKHIYGINTESYSWVADYIRDKKTRGDIARLEGEIEKARKQPMHRDEVKAEFETTVKTIRAGFLNRLSEQIRGVQNRQKDITLDVPASMAFAVLAFLEASPGTMEMLVSQLPEGIRQNDIEHTVTLHRKEIAKLKQVIDTEWSPQSRWVHWDTGHPIGYPSGCRWTLFVNDWKTVVSRFDGRVNIEGCEFSSGAEAAAFELLELDRVRKITPLRKAHKG